MSGTTPGNTTEQHNAKTKTGIANNKNTLFNRALRGLAESTALAHLDRVYQERAQFKTIPKT